VPAYCGVQRRALPDWLMTVGKLISNGCTAMLEHSINKNADTLTKIGINQPQPKSTQNSHKNSNDTMVKNSLQVHNKQVCAVKSRDTLPCHPN